MTQTNLNKHQYLSDKVESLKEKLQKVKEWPLKQKKDESVEEAKVQVPLKIPLTKAESRDDVIGSVNISTPVVLKEDRTPQVEALNLPPIEGEKPQKKLQFDLKEVECTIEEDESAPLTEQKPPAPAKPRKLKVIKKTDKQIVMRKRSKHSP